MREPYLLRPWEIAKLTPRQIFDQYFAPRDEKTGEVLPDEEPDWEDEPMTPKVSRNKMKGLQGIKGMGFEKHACFAPTAAEREIIAQGLDPADFAPFLVPRELARERFETLIYEQARSGRFEGGLEINDTHAGTVTKYPAVKRTDRAAIRDLFDHLWALDCAKYERLKAERGKNGVQENRQGG